MSLQLHQLIQLYGFIGLIIGRIMRQVSLVHIMGDTIGYTERIAAQLISMVSKK